MTRAIKSRRRRDRPATVPAREPGLARRLREERRERARRTGWAVGRGATPGRLGMAVLLLLWLGLCAAPIWFSLPDLALATGRAGVPGTVRVVSCESLGKGRYDCRGRFTPEHAAGGPVTEVRLSPDSEAGEVYPAQFDPATGRAAPNGARGVWAVAGLMALGPLCFGFLPYCVLFAAGAGPRARRGAVVFGVALTAASALFMGYAFAASA